MSKPTKILILLMGETGAGKSHFINAATDNAPAHDNQTVKTPEVTAYTVRSTSAEQVILLDTPGFNPEELDNKILWRIIEWLEKPCNSDLSFGGVIYLYDITQTRVASTDTGYGPSGPVVYFSSPDPASHLLLITTKGDQLTPEEYRAREDALKNAARWEGMVRRGAGTYRFENTQTSARKAIDTLLELQPLTLSAIRKELGRIHGEKKALLSKIAANCCKALKREPRIEKARGDGYRRI